MNINQLIKGIIIGIAKIIPGLSGAVLMISFNLYDKAIDAITNFFDNPKKNFLFLLNLGIGVVLGIVLFSKIIHYFITNYYLYTTALFLGLIIGGIPVITKRIDKKISNYWLALIAFSLVFSLSFLGTNQDYVLKNTYVDLIVFFIAGFLEAVGTVLPGISSTALLMLMGVYNHYLVILGGALNLGSLLETLRFVLPFLLGMLIGVIGLSILINYLFKSYKDQTFSLILGISVSSVFLLGKNLVPFVTTFKDLLIAGIMLLIGYLVTNKLE
ncbi:MAG: DUF368 domain-containing protein [Bacilli bacterium]|nr:DUF368 domain-containing protein [Bacilli bacterium]